tara:strand:+ start:493 stop:1233 length:741 start_codon:yes stop_codon:yes gene_type:complete
MKLKALLSAGCFVASIAAGSAHAVPIIYFGEDLDPGNVVGPNASAAQGDFIGALGDVGTEDFESFSSGQQPPLNLIFPGSNGDITASLSATSGVEIESGASGAGRFPTSGSNYLEMSSGSDFTIAFGTAISAFGFLGTDIGDFVNGFLTISLTDINDVVTDLEVMHTRGSAADSNVLFWGFTDTGNSYTSLSFSNPGGGDVFGFDDMTIGDRAQVDPDPQPVPAPATLALFGLGLAGLGWSRRKKA